MSSMCTEIVVVHGCRRKFYLEFPFSFLLFHYSIFYYVFILLLFSSNFIYRPFSSDNNIQQNKNIKKKLYRISWRRFTSLKPSESSVSSESFESSELISSESSESNKIKSDFTSGKKSNFFFLCFERMNLKDRLRKIFYCDRWYGKHLKNWLFEKMRNEKEMRFIPLCVVGKL